MNDNDKNAIVGGLYIVKLSNIRVWNSSKYIIDHSFTMHNNDMFVVYGIERGERADFFLIITPTGRQGYIGHTEPSFCERL